jgi:hypothetical protein
MPEIGTILLLLNVIFVVHAARSGRFWPWAYVILFLPGFGVAAYLLFEVLPEWRRSPGVRHGQGQIVKALDPGRRYRVLLDELETADTVGNRLALAEECLNLGKYDEALHLFERIIHSPQGDEPLYYFGRAKAEFGLGQPDKTLETLDELKRHWPNYRSQEAHLLYGVALEQLGRYDEALSEFSSLSRYYAGPEPKVRQMRLLDQMGRKNEARDIAQDVVNGLKRAPSFVRKTQAEWFAAAKSYLRT